MSKLVDGETTHFFCDKLQLLQLCLIDFNSGPVKTFWIHSTQYTNGVHPTMNISSFSQTLAFRTPRRCCQIDTFNQSRPGKSGSGKNTPRSRSRLRKSWSDMQNTYTYSIKDCNAMILLGGLFLRKREFNFLHCVPRLCAQLKVEALSKECYTHVCSNSHVRKIPMYCNTTCSIFFVGFDFTKKGRALG